MSSAGKIFKNTGALAVGRIITKAASLVFLGYVTRVLGESGFGRFSTAMALVGFVEIFPGYIGRTYIIRQFAREREASGPFLSGVLASNVLLSFALFFEMILVVPLLGYAGDTNTACLVLAASLLFSSLTNSYHALFAGHERMELSAYADVFNTALTIALAVPVLAMGGQVVALVGAYAGARVVTFFLARRFARPLLDDSRFIRPSAALLKTMSIGAWPFFITQLFIIFYNRADIVMLSFMNQPMDKEIAVGHYNAAYKLMEAMGLVTSAFVAAVYPVLARKFLEGADGVLVTFRKAFRILAAFVFPVAVGTTILASDLMGLLFGESFAGAALALQILIWGQAMDSINPLAAVTMRALEKERDLARITGVCAVFNVALNIVLIPRFSYNGAAAATLLSFLLVYVWSRHVLARELGTLHIVAPVVRTIVASAAMGAVVWWARAYGLAAAIAAGVAAYALFAAVLGVMSREEWNLVTARFRRAS
ncbi:MAG: flippase [Deltaproteobacteria bacterium]|nr:flippase [Deltaproteobacteria bacterium]